jgi:NAD-dependent SIR2 family protein deacetylase
MSNSSNSSNECVIPYCSGDDTSTNMASCNHRMHRHCSTKWKHSCIRKNIYPTCPKCRARFKQRIHYVNQNIDTVYKEACITCIIIDILLITFLSIVAILIFYY